jgi:hypothetical protein
MTLSGVEWVRVPSPSTPLGTLSLSNGHVEGLALGATGR